jgi:hypothetical protein
VRFASSDSMPSSEREIEKMRWTKLEWRECRYSSGCIECSVGPCVRSLISPFYLSHRHFTLMFISSCFHTGFPRAVYRHLFEPPPNNIIYAKYPISLPSPSTLPLAHGDFISRIMDNLESLGELVHPIFDLVFILIASMI